MNIRKLFSFLSFCPSVLVRACENPKPSKIYNVHLVESTARARVRADLG